MVDSIEKIHEKGVNLRKFAEDLLIIFKERMNIEDLYSQDLERLSHKLNNQFFPEISEFVKKTLLQVSSVSANISSQISSKIIPNLKELINTQALEIKDIYIEGLKNEKRKNRLGQKISDAKLRYWGCCEQCEQAAVSLDSEPSLSKKEKLVSKLLSNKATLDNFYKSYLEAIEKYNKFRKTYLIKTKKFLVSYAENDRSLCECLNVSIREYVLIESQKNTLTETFSSLVLTIEDTTNLLKYPEASFEAYEGSHPLFKNIGIHSAPHLHTSILESTGADIGTSSAVENLYRKDIELIIEKAWEGVEPNSNEYLRFNVSIKEHLGRKAWSWSMNLKRTQGIFRIEKKGFDLVSELMIAVLNECERCEDVVIAKNCIILSQTFYMIVDNSKLYLQSSIINHSLWENPHFWKKIVNSAICEEIKNQGSDELQSHLKSLVFCQLVSFGNIMLSFKAPDAAISELIQTIASGYEFSQEEVMEILVRFR